VFDDSVFPFASLHPNAGRRLTQDILLLPTPHNGCTDGDTQYDNHMSLPIIPVVTNPAQDTTPHTAAEDHDFQDDHTSKNLSENDEETSENNSIFDAAEEDNMGTGSEADSPAALDPDGANPDEDSPDSCQPVGTAAVEQHPHALARQLRPRALAPLRVFNQCIDRDPSVAPAAISGPVPVPIATWSAQVPARRSPAACWW
jgi:hypothetical protein